MPTFAYSAINAQGDVQAGEISATDLSSARDALRGSGLLADWLQELKAPVASDSRRGMFGRKKKVKAKSLQIFSRQFATMIEAGLSVVTALVVLEQQTDDPALGAVIDDVRERVEGGAFLSEAMSQHSDTFNRLYVAMVEAGEAAGVLDTVLDRVATQIEKEEKIKRRVKGAMIYPVVVLCFATLVLAGMLMFLVPVFQKIFDSLGGDLPTLTQYIVHASNGLRSYWFIIFPAFGFIIFAFRRWKKSEPGPQDLGSLQASRADDDRPGRPQGFDGALVADAVDLDRRRRRHRQCPRHHGRDGRKLGRRERDGAASRPCAGGCDDRTAADRE